MRLGERAMHPIAPPATRSAKVSHCQLLNCSAVIIDRASTGTVSSVVPISLLRRARVEASSVSSAPFSLLFTSASVVCGTCAV